MTIVDFDATTVRPREHGLAIDMPDGTAFLRADDHYTAMVISGGRCLVEMTREGLHHLAATRRNASRAQSRGSV